MAHYKLFYVSKTNANFPSLTSAEQSRTEIAQYLDCVIAKHLQLSQSEGMEARLVADISHNNLTFEHLQYLTDLLLGSSIQLFALDLSWNCIFAPAWSDILPVVRQLLTKAKHIDLAGNYLPNIFPESRELKDMLQQNASFSAPNLYLGSTPWMRHWTSKAHEFRKQAYRSAFWLHLTVLHYSLKQSEQELHFGHRSACYSAASSCCA